MTNEIPAGYRPSISGADLAPAGAGLPALTLQQAMRQRRIARDAVRSALG